MPLNILVVGPTGQIGSEVMLRLPTASPLFKSKLNLLNPYLIKEILAGEKFDLLINCAGLTDIEYCEEHPDEADAINHRSVGEMASFCAETEKLFIHISDGGMIFDGTSDEPYDSGNRSLAPINHYGSSKRLGESSVKTAFGLLSPSPESNSGADSSGESPCDRLNSVESSKYCIIRSASVFGPALGRTNFLEKLIASAMRCKEAIKVASWRRISPTSARELAKTIGVLVDSLGEGASRGFPASVIHVANAGGPVSQAEAAAFAISQIPSLSHMKVISVPKPGKSLPRIPANTALADSRSQCLPPPLGPSETWQEAINGYLLQKGYARPACALEVEADAEYSVTKVWEKLQRGVVPIDALIEGLRKDRMNWMAGMEGPGRKAKKGFWKQLGDGEEEKKGTE